jgi:hypothetical protein
MLQFTKRKPGIRETSFSNDKQTVEGNLLLVDQNESELWLKKHRPTTVKDLAMHASRVPLNNHCLILILIATECSALFIFLILIAIEFSALFISLIVIDCSALLCGIASVQSDLLAFH